MPFFRASPLLYLSTRNGNSRFGHSVRYTNLYHGQNGTNRKSPI
nr:MAG TPA: hypothetical protein [Caudoviricetes sp.]